MTLLDVAAAPSNSNSRATSTLAGAILMPTPSCGAKAVRLLPASCLSELCVTCYVLCVVWATELSLMVSGACTKVLLQAQRSAAQVAAAKQGLQQF